jgi:hypothetical protein
MKSNVKALQILLILIGVFLIIATYFLKPAVDELNLAKNNPETEEIIIEKSETQSFFENVQYKGSYDVINPYTIKAEKALISNDDPDTVYMTTVHVIIYMSDGDNVNIWSENAVYEKVKNNIFFNTSVKATNGKTIILSQNLNLFSDEKYASIYNDVNLTNDSGSLKADVINYDFETKLYDIAMFGEDLVKVKLIK